MHLRIRTYNPVYMRMIYERVRASCPICLLLSRFDKWYLHAHSLELLHLVPMQLTAMNSHW